jgi:hypothetical protein
MSAQSHHESNQPAAPAATPTRSTSWLDTFFKYAAAVAVDHTHMLPLDRVSGRTGHVTPAKPGSACCSCC